MLNVPDFKPRRYQVALLCQEMPYNEYAKTQFSYNKTSTKIPKRTEELALLGIQITRQFTTSDTRRIDATQDLQTDTDAHYLSLK